MNSPLRYLSSLLFSLSLTASAQTFVEGDYQINRKKATAGFEVAELLAGSNITITWNNAAKTATLTSPLSSTGGTSITTLGTITTGTWQATPIADTYIASAATWNAKQAAGNYLTALTGDVTATGPGSVAATIANDAVTYAKMQNVSSASRLLGRGSSGAGDVQELTIGTGLAFSGTSLVVNGYNPFDQDLNTTDAPQFDSVTLNSGNIASGTNNLQFTHVGPEGDVPYISVKLNNGTDDIGQTLLGFRGDGLGSGTSFIQGATATFRIEQDGGTLATVEAANISGTNTGDVTLAGTPDYITISGQTITRNAIDLATDITGVTPVANGGTGAATLTANNVLLGNGTSALQAVAPGTNGNVLTSDGTTWTSAAPATTNPAGSGSELQFRSSGTAFGAVTNSSVSGGTLTLGNAEALGTTPTSYLTLRNTTAAAAGVQQVSPSLVLEGRGWKTDATAGSQTVRFRQNILPVQGTANPSATWRLQSEINNSGTWTDRATMTTPGVFAVSGDSNTITLDAKDASNIISATRHINITPGNGWTLFLNAPVQVASSSTFGFSSDVVLARDAANTLAQRNGTNAQTFRLYETDSGANDEYLEFSAASGTNVIRPQATGTGTASVVRYHTTTAVFWTSGSGSPESVVTAPIGSLYTRTDGGASTTLYVKESGTGSTGWIAK